MINNILYETEKNICFHKYLTHCITNPQPPGFADFLRGTITLYNLSKKYNYDLIIDSEHKVFSYLKKNKYIEKSELFDTIELLPPLSYDEIYYKLEEIFKTNYSFSILTNSFYQDLHTNELINWGEITEDCRNYLLNILQPSDEILNKIDYIFENIYKFSKDDYFETIHIRTNDSYISDVNKEIDYYEYQYFYNKIINFVNTKPETKLILIIDSSKIGQKLKEDISCLNYWNNLKIHLGDLKNYSENSVLDTLVDFFIFSKSKNINATSESGFSKVASIIYKINYNVI